MEGVHELVRGMQSEGGRRLTFLYFCGMLCIDKKSEPKMVGSAYLYSGKISAIQTALADDGPPYILKKSSVAGRLFCFWTYAEGLLTNDADQFQQELPVNDPEGRQHDQGEED